MEMRIPTEHVAERLVRDDHAGEDSPTGDLAVKVAEQAIDQPGYPGEQTPIVAEEWSKRLWNGEDELAM